MTVWDKVSLLTVQAVENSEVNPHSSCHNPCYTSWAQILVSLKQSDILLEVWVPYLGSILQMWLNHACFHTCAIECQDLNTQRSGDTSYPRASLPLHKWMDSVCLDHVRSEASSTPKYLKHWVSTCSSTWPQSDNTGRWRGFPFLDISMELHLLTSKQRWFTDIHSTM